MRLIVLLLFFFNFIISSEDSDSVIESKLLSQIEYALSCNAKFSYINEVEILNVKYIKDDFYKINGSYKSVLSGSIGTFLSFGGEEHPIKGIFIAIVKIKDEENIKIQKLFWKISFKRGFVKNECLRSLE